MKVSCLQEDLKRGLSIVNRAASVKSPLPIMGCVLLTTDKGKLRVSATDLSMSITHWVDATTDTEGGVAVPARLLTDVVGHLPNDRVFMTLDMNAQSLHLRCSRFEMNIRCANASDFPLVPIASEDANGVVFSQATLREAIRQVAFAANANEDSRLVLQGVHLRFGDQRAIFAAADGVRLARKVIESPELTTQTDAPIIPARALQELDRLLTDRQGAVRMIISSVGGQVIFRTNESNLSTNLIDGAFPNIDRVIPNACRTRSVVSAPELRRAIRSASVFAAETMDAVMLRIKPGFNADAGVLELYVNNAKVGDHLGEIVASVQGDGGEITLSARMLAEAIAAIPTEQVSLEIQSARDPAVFRPVGRDDAVHVIMPMRMI